MRSRAADDVAHEVRMRMRLWGAGERHMDEVRARRAVDDVGRGRPDPLEAAQRLGGGGARGDQSGQGGGSGEQGAARVRAGPVPVAFRAQGLGRWRTGFVAKHACSTLLLAEFNAPSGKLKQSARRRFRAAPDKYWVSGMQLSGDSVFMVEIEVLISAFVM